MTKIEGVETSYTVYNASGESVVMIDNHRIDVCIKNTTGKWVSFDKAYLPTVIKILERIDSEES